ncbi:AI-2E family transporter [Fodinicurvata sediminis]|uniref:AI-2E family transporter n=1 Tax=Fodinicurvata sediminis TaxID=1121832 RepID=UPI0003B53344|nr:AI-2E family transporter [Fodinicurvata sediminis]
MDMKGDGMDRTARLAHWSIIFGAASLFILVLYLSRPVTLPLAFGLFLMAIVWPVQDRLDRRFPRWVGFLTSVLLIVLAFGGFFGLLALSVILIGDGIAAYRYELDRAYFSVLAWAAANGFPVNVPNVEEMDIGPMVGMAASALDRVNASIALIGLTFIYIVLGLLEVRDFGSKLRSLPTGDLILDAIQKISHKFRRYIVVRTFVSLLTGLLTYLFALVLGLEFALTWGLIAFILNYIPFLGSILAVIPPVVFATVQFNDWLMPLLVLLGTSTIQIVLGNYVDPRLEGRALALSPLVVVISIFFWGMIWGVAGAFIGVPATIAIITICDQFEQTQWLARLAGSRIPGKTKTKY